MKRRKFFQYLGLGAVVAVVPKVVESVPVEESNGDVLVKFVKDNFTEAKARRAGGGHCINPKEIGVHPGIVTVTKNPVRIGDNWVIGLSGNPRPGYDILIPENFTNAHGMSSWRIMSRVDNETYLLTGYNVKDCINDIPVGAKLYLGGSVLPELYTAYYSELDKGLRGNH